MGTGHETLVNGHMDEHQRFCDWFNLTHSRMLTLDLSRTRPFYRGLGGLPKVVVIPTKKGTPPSLKIKSTRGVLIRGSIRWSYLVL